LYRFLLKIATYVYVIADRKFQIADSERIIAVKSIKSLKKILNTTTSNQQMTTIFMISLNLS